MDHAQPENPDKSTDRAEATPAEKARKSVRKPRKSAGQSRRQSKRPAHAPTKKTKVAVARILEIVGVGGSWAMAAAAAGISVRTLERWREADVGFADRLACARDVGAVKLVDRIRTAAEGGDWRAAQWILERMMPDQYGRRVMIGGVSGSPIQIEAEAKAAQSVRADMDASRVLHEAIAIAAGAAINAHSNGKASTNGHS